MITPRVSIYMEKVKHLDITYRYIIRISTFHCWVEVAPIYRLQVVKDCTKMAASRCQVYRYVNKLISHIKKNLVKTVYLSLMFI